MMQLSVMKKRPTGSLLLRSETLRPLEGIALSRAAGASASYYQTTTGNLSLTIVGSRGPKVTGGFVCILPATTICG